MRNRRFGVYHPDMSATPIYFETTEPGALDFFQEVAPTQQEQQKNEKNHVSSDMRSVPDLKIPRLRRRRFRSDWDEIRQDRPSSEHSSIDRVGFLIWRHILNIS